MAALEGKREVRLMHNIRRLTIWLDAFCADRVQIKYYGGTIVILVMLIMCPRPVQPVRLVCTMNHLDATNHWGSEMPQI